MDIYCVLITTHKISVKKVQEKTDSSSPLMTYRGSHSRGTVSLEKLSVSLVSGTTSTRDAIRNL